ncbi:MAG TPA: hypothetical protein VFS36_01500 [Chitinophagaceae bacterium]|nr:hypothetical protein [Chitinophagaceae bacterium]
MHEGKQTASGGAASLGDCEPAFYNPPGLLPLYRLPAAKYAILYIWRDAQQTRGVAAPAVMG